MRKKIEWAWEKLDDHTRRAKVIGGWLVHCFTCVPNMYDANKVKGVSESMQFVSDRDHEWHIVAPVVETKKQDYPEL